MTPFEIGVLLHYFVGVGDCQACIDNVPIWRETCLQMQADDLIESGSERARKREATYALTPKGEFYVSEGLCKVPLPVQIFTFQTPERTDAR